MEGLIVNFRGGRRTQVNNQMIVGVDSIETKDKAKALVGKKVVWKSNKGKAINGEIRSFHGNSGKLRVLFEKGMPGQAIGTKVVIQ